MSSGVHFNDNHTISCLAQEANAQMNMCLGIHVLTSEPDFESSPIIS